MHKNIFESIYIQLLSNERIFIKNLVLINVHTRIKHNIVIVKHQSHKTQHQAQ